MLLSLHALAWAPRWTEEQTGGVAGRCRGDLVGPWGENLRRRFGDDAVARVRARLPAELRDLDPAPTTRHWLPARAQLLVTEAIIDELLAGDASALYPLVVEDVRRGSSKIGLALLRSLGPRRMLRLAPRTHRKVYDVGRARAEVNPGGARIDFRDAALFAHPTWRLLQVYATGVLLELQGAKADLTGEDTGPDSFAVHLRWQRRG